MVRALQLAERGLYTTDPNPRVGCVLVKEGELVGEGWHYRAGLPHAEIVALAHAGENARGSTAYVTLEPCCHHGRTPPCSDALIDAGVVRVVAAMQDPNPVVGGKGLARLRAAGIRVESGLMQAQAEALNPGFIRRMSANRPYVRCKLAMSLDGRTAMASGESKWISSDASRRDVHRLRARSSAIVTGIGTVLADDPSMTVRLHAEELQGVEDNADICQPLRVVVDSSLRTPVGANILQSQDSNATLIVTASRDAQRRDRLLQAGAEVLTHADEPQVSLSLLCEQLAQRQINELLIEAGPTLAGAALQAGIIDEFIIYMAPHLMGNSARGLFNLPGLEHMAQRIPLSIKDVRQIGPDFRLTLTAERN
ncbi:MAG: bifunctional diaminohydroxyphosphoribosylaminopyrimidine deaminase/5-amino-6-(5-phosphoribosylamino)uracil reductase RibD [Pseudomonadota bacterium]|nr:bifunctional diaminohydroxyphosphoribosylaminopyrimidine deaminase/5-amino-6-(5-phosphoribosylamino)uracil reductase RibD [Pseudomonadota bacterium]